MLNIQMYTPREFLTKLLLFFFKKKYCKIPEAVGSRNAVGPKWWQWAIWWQAAGSGSSQSQAEMAAGLRAVVVGHVAAGSGLQAEMAAGP